MRPHEPHAERTGDNRVTFHPTPSTAPSPTPTFSPLPDGSFPIAFPIADTLTTGGRGRWSRG
ncbi:hypothetical protein G7085_06110 [Tessaracoccus sp. HDW20]|uniref:hypothetical protein n=1 Tax=Tessaracoccus coleopterorum TaxID=2714950 RepID=UPI0018D43D1E|nr:hypothetical protein [Tessaracoccus coleopterorum]NHB84326.1 hypothetical protein [Tessaracoccus coleopterorum]